MVINLNNSSSRSSYTQIIAIIATGSLDALDIIISFSRRQIFGWTTNSKYSVYIL